MPTGLFIGLIVGGSLLVILVFYFIYRSLTRVSYAQKLLGNTTAKLEKAKDNNSVESKINKLKALSDINPKFLDFYHNSSDTFVSLISVDYEDISIELNKIYQAISDHELKDVVSRLKKANEAIDKLEENIKELNEGIDAYFERERMIRDHMLNSKERVRNLKEIYDESANELEICKGKLESIMGAIDQLFVSTETNLDNGEYDAAKKDVEEADEKTEVLSKYLEVLPKIVVKGVSLLPKKAEELVNRYETMKEEGYPLLIIPFKEEREKIEKRLEKIKLDLIDAKYETKESEYQQLNVIIDEINAKLDDEVKAKEVYDDYQDKIYHNSDELSTRYLKYKREMKDVKELYVISQHYEEFFAEMEQDINAMNSARRDFDNLNYGSFKQPYSLLKDKMVALAEANEIVEKKLNEYGNYLNSLRDDIQYAYEFYINFSIALNEAKSKIYHTNHRILIDKYQERFEEGNRLLSELYGVITTQPMDVVKCNELLSNVKDFIQKLLADAENDSSDHDIAENAIVFANQYRNVFSKVADTLVLSEKYFNEGEFRNSIIATTDVLKEFNPHVYNKYMEQR